MHRTAHRSPLVVLMTLLLAVATLVALPGSRAPARAAPAPENVTTVNATGERFALSVGGQTFDVEPEEMSIQIGALRFCDTCTLMFGEHTFEASLVDGSGTTQTVATLTTSITADPDLDHSLVFHYGPDGGFALSVFHDDARPMPETETRVEIRHVAQGGAVDYVLTSNGENESVPNDLRTGQLANTQWVRHYQVTVNDYELQVYPAGATQDAAHLAACNPDLELEGAASVVVYVAGRIVPAQDLDDTDVDHTQGFAATCLALANAEGAYQRSAFSDGYAVRGYDGPAMTMGVPGVTKDPNATVSSPTGPAAPYATSTSGGGSGDPGGTDTAPTVTFTSPADGSVQSGTITLAADATDDDGVTEVVFAVDGTAIGAVSSAPYELDWDSSGVADGGHELTATATDSAGQTATATVTVTTDNTPLMFTVCPAAPVLDETQVGDQLTLDLATNEPAEFSAPDPGVTVAPRSGTSTTATLQVPDRLKPDAIDLATGDRSTSFAVLATQPASEVDCAITVTVEVVDFAMVRSIVTSALPSGTVQDKLLRTIDKAESRYRDGRHRQADRALEKAASTLERAVDRPNGITSADRAAVAPYLSELRNNLPG